MLSTTSAIQAAWLSSARKLSIKITMGGTIYDNDTVSTLTFDSGSFSGENFQIGATYVNSIKVTFPTIIESVTEGVVIIAAIGITVNQKIEYTPLGKFIITEFDRDRNSQTTTVTANDEMGFLEGPYQSKLKYPARIRDVALEIANLAGVEVDKASFASLQTQSINRPIGYSYRQAIGLIAQFEGGFATFNRYGKLSIRGLMPTDLMVTPKSYLLKGFKKNENSYRIGGITVKTGKNNEEVLRVGSRQGAQIELDNSVMTYFLLVQLWGRVNRIRYFPFELRWQGLPSLEAGDWFYLQDKGRKYYSVPNLSYSFEYNGGLVAKSSANTSATGATNYRYRGALSQKIEYIDSILSSNGWNSNYYDSETAPENPKVGDLWFKQNGQDIEIWIYKVIEGEADWGMEISTAPNKELKEAIETTQKAAETAKEQANEAVNSANQAIKDSGLALSSAQGVQHEVNRIDGLAASALNEAESAKKQAEALLGTLDVQSNQLISLSADVNIVKGEMALKVNQTDFNALNSTLISQGTLINQNTKEIGLKANQTEVSTINNTVISHSASIKIQSDSITNLVTKTDGQQAQISNLELESNKITSTVSNVQHDLENLGSGNLLPRTDFKNINISDFKQWWQSSNSSTVEFNDHTYTTMAGTPLYHERKLVVSPKNTEVKETFLNPYWPDSQGSFKDYCVLKPNTTYTMSFWSFLETSAKSLTFVAWSYDDSGGNRKLHKKITELSPVVNTPNLVSYRFTTSELINYQLRLYIGYDTTATSGRRAFFTEMQLTESMVRMAWGVSDWDRTNVKQFSKLEQTALGIQSTVANLETNTQTQITQLNNQITSVVKNVADLNYVGANLWAPDSLAEKNQIGYLARDGTIQPALNYYYSDPILVGSHKNVTFTAFELPRNTPHFRIAFYDASGVSKGFHNLTATVSGQVITVAVSNGASYFVFDCPIPSRQGGKIKVEFGDKATDYSVSPLDTATQSQITQLSNRINLRVEKNDVVNQINLSSEGILIAGRKVHITGQTTIANGVIQNAMIANSSITGAKIQNATIASAKIINVDASKIVVNNLSALTTNTGTLNITGWLNITTDNRGMRGSYNFGDSPTVQYPRWHVGDYRISHRHLIFTSEQYRVNANGTRGGHFGYAEGFLGANYYKSRWYNRKTNGELRGRIDMRDNFIQVASSWGEGDLVGTVIKPSIIFAAELSILEITARSTGANIYFNRKRANLADFRIGLDGAGRLVQSVAIYNRTYSWNGGNVTITNHGSLGRATSASKYKLNISKVPNSLFYAKKLLDLHLMRWFDKNSVNRHAELLTKKDKISSEEYYIGEIYGLIAEDVAAVGLEKYCQYNEAGEIEGIAYDRLGLLLIPLVKDLYKKIEKLERRGIS